MSGRRKWVHKDPSALSVCKLRELAPSPRIHLLSRRIILSSNILLISGRYWIYRSTGTTWQKWSDSKKKCLPTFIENNSLVFMSASSMGVYESNHICSNPFVLSLGLMSRRRLNQATVYMSQQIFISSHKKMRVVSSSSGAIANSALFTMKSLMYMNQVIGQCENDQEGDFISQWLNSC